MKLLLDTHAAIWFIMDSDQLPENTKQRIKTRENECFISIASLWEMGIKFSLGKLQLKTDLKRIFEMFFESGFTLLPVMPEHVLTNASMPFKHRDPFDRLILAQAIREGYSIISKDRAFEHYDVNVIWD